MQVEFENFRKQSLNIPMIFPICGALVRSSVHPLQKYSGVPSHQASGMA